MDYNFFARSYNELYEEEQINKLKIIKEYLKLKKSDKLLDIGCGTGISTNFFKCNTQGIDPSKEMMKLGKGKREEGKAEDLKFKNSSFDIILAITSIHNFDDPKKAIEEIKRVSKKNAQIVITLLKKSPKYNSIKKLIEIKLEIIKEIDETKDTIFMCKNVK